MKRTVAWLLFSILLAQGCGRDTSSAPVSPGTASEFTRTANQAASRLLPLDDQQDFRDATRGLIASPSNLIVKKKDGTVIWDQTAYGFMKGKAPDTVNPSLWRQARLNNIHGLFRVTEGIYQLRGFDLANMTLIRGSKGWIVVDPLMAKETARTAFKFAMQHLENRPVTAVIYSHSHVDHFGGTLGIITPEQAAANKVRIIAPQGFIEEAVSENIIAGIVMGRRSIFMYGRQLPRSATGHVGSGLGKEPAYGSIGILVPTETVDKTPVELNIDGVRFVFQYTPASEAPAEMTFYLPESKVFCGAEIVSRNLHNLYTLRGTKVRDAMKWAGYIDEAITLFGDAGIYFGTHHWPVWGNEKVVDFLKKQRDSYKFIHDQTIRLANQGLTSREIAEELRFPESLEMSFPNRGYYGTLRHNAKAVYQHYFGWYDGNPSNLDPLPPEQAAVKYIDYMGGATKVLAMARESFGKGEYRWVAEIVSHVLFSDPDNVEAKELLAVTYEQLGYQAESGPWRDAYLTGAYELRGGERKEAVDIESGLDLLMQSPISNFLDSMATRLNAPKAEGRRMSVNLVFTDLNESYLLDVENSVLHHRRSSPEAEANATVRLTHAAYLKVAIGKLGVKDLLLSDDIQFKGSRLDLIRFFSMFDMPDGRFNIVTP